MPLAIYRFLNQRLPGAFSSRNGCNAATALRCYQQDTPPPPPPPPWAVTAVVSRRCQRKLRPLPPPLSFREAVTLLSSESSTAVLPQDGRATPIATTFLLYRHLSFFLPVNCRLHQWNAAAVPLATVTLFTCCSQVGNVNHCVELAQQCQFRCFPSALLGQCPNCWLPFVIFGNKTLPAEASPAAAMPALRSLAVCAGIRRDGVAVRQPRCCGCHPLIVTGCPPLIVACHYLSCRGPCCCILLTAHGAPAHIRAAKWGLTASTISTEKPICS